MLKPLELQLKYVYILTFNECNGSRNGVLKHVDLLIST